MAATVILPVASYLAGTRTITHNVPLGITHVKISATRTLWLDTGSDILKLDCEISLDNGTTFQYLAGFTTGGGILPDTPNTMIGMDIPKPQRPQRVLRLTVQNFITLTTSISIDLS